MPTRTMGALGQYRCISGIHFLLTFSRLCRSANAEADEGDVRVVIKQMSAI